MGFVINGISVVFDFLLFAILLLFLKESVGHLGLDSLNPCSIEFLLSFKLVILSNSLMKVFRKLFSLDNTFEAVVFHFVQIG